MRVLMALSGGVDSAVAAARLLEEGDDVIAVHLRTGVEADGEAAGGSRSCCGADDARDARRVAARLGLPFYVVDVADAFGGVIEDFIQSYARGRTPNPCVLCNRDVKFGRLLEIATELGADCVATGHYARIGRTDDGRFRLQRAFDRKKDQTYVLYPLSQTQLGRARFPLGEAGAKDEIRAEAARLGLEVASKPDSQDLCFVPGGDYRKVLRERAPEVLVPGEIRDLEDGRVIGHHDGAAGFTRGQRRGLPAVGRARYVAHVDSRTGRVDVAPRAALLQQVVHVAGANWIDRPEPDVGTTFRVHAQIRHAGAAESATLLVMEGGRLRVRFEAGVFAPAPGQALVAYVDDAVLVGGTIEENIPPGPPGPERD